MATPDAAAQISASDHRVLGEAGLVGGSLPFVFRQPARSSARVAEPAATPLSDPNTFQSNRRSAIAWRVCPISRRRTPVGCRPPVRRDHPPASGKGPGPAINVGDTMMVTGGLRSSATMAARSSARLNGDVLTEQIPDRDRFLEAVRKGATDAERRARGCVVAARPPVSRWRWHGLARRGRQTPRRSMPSEACSTRRTASPPGDPAFMPAAVIAGVGREPAPLRMIPGSAALQNTLTVAQVRVAHSAAQTELAGSPDFLAGE